MRPTLPWTELGTAGALYAAASAWSATHGAPAHGIVVALLALATALAPRAIARSAGAAARERPTVLAAGAFTAVAVGTLASGAAAPTTLHAVARAMATVCAGGAAALALVALRAPVTLAPGTRWSAAAGTVVVAIALIPWALRGELPSTTPAALLAGLSALALISRSGDPDARARAVLAATGCAAGALLALAGALAGPGARGALLPALGAVVAAAGLALAAAGALRERAPELARAALAVGGGCALGAVAARAASANAAAALGALGAGSAMLALRASWLGPDRGRLLAACARARARIEHAERSEDVAAAALDPLRSAARDLRARAELWVLTTETRFRLDVSGAAHGSPLVLAAERAVLAFLRTRGAELALVDALRPLEVRRPELRPVLAALDEAGALAAVPLHVGAELLGVMLVPRGRRRAVLELAELRALEALGRRSAGALAASLAREHESARARRAEHDAAQLRESLALALAARDDAERRARPSRPVRAVGSLEDAWVGYSPAMRAFEARALAAAAEDTPLLLLVETGVAVASLARRIHAASARAGAPCVLLDAASIHPRDAVATLVGAPAEAPAQPDAPGWLALAAGGTLVLEELPALGYDAHLALLEALRAGTRARILATSRTPLADAGVPAELAARFSATLAAPPLRDRAEDLETLVLFALDRACRVLGRPSVGIARDALAALRAYHWPGNERELFAALEDAAQRARGDRVTLEDLPHRVAAAAPAGARPSAPPAGAGENYESLERRLLEQALERAQGNKSEAARALGLARTTLLDKLRKYGLRA